MSRLCEHRDIFGHCTEQPDDIFTYAVASSNLFDVPPTPPLPPQPVINIKNDKPEHRDEEVIKSRGYRVPKIKTEKMTETERIKAKLARSAMINKTQGIEQAQNYLNENGLETYKIDTEHSTRDAIVVRDEGVSDAEVMDFINSKETVSDAELMDYINSKNTVSNTELVDYINSKEMTGENVSNEELLDYINSKENATSNENVSDAELLEFMTNQNITSDTELVEYMSNKQPVEYKVVFAGTDVNDAGDIKTDVEILAGKKSTEIQQMNDGRELIRNATESFGRPPEELIGFSLGGNKAITIGAELKIPSTTFNPLIGDEIVRGGKIFGDHTILRTPTDPASLNIARGKNNFNMKNVDVIDTRLDPVDSHGLRHFTDEPTQTRGKMSSSVIEAIHPTNLAGGLVAALAGEGLANVIDPDGQNKHAVAHQALAGASTGLITATGAAALAGEGLTMTALLPEVVAGTIGFATAQAVTGAVAKDLQESGASNTTVGIVSNVAGGGAGGAAAGAGGSLAAAGIAFASGAEMGTEAGLVFAPETLGLSVVAGATLGAVIGLGAYGVSQISPNVGHSVNQQVVKPAENAINNAANDVASGISKSAKSVGKWFSGW